MTITAFITDDEINVYRTEFKLGRATYVREIQIAYGFYETSVHALRECGYVPTGPVVRYGGHKNLRSVNVRTVSHVDVW